MTVATAPACSLSKADQKKLHTFGFHAPNDPTDYDPEAIGAISVFEYVLNAKEDGLKTTKIGQIRFRRFTTDQAIKTAKAVVKQLNAGENPFPACNVISVPTGRPRGRRPQS